MEPTLMKEAGQRFRILKIVWTAILMSLVLFLFICHFVRIPIELDQSADAAIEGLVYVFYALAVAQFFLAHFLRRALLSSKKPASATPSPEAQTVQTRQQILAKYSAAVIVSLAIAESIGILSLVLFFFTGNFQTLYILMVVSAVAIIYHRPKKEELAGLLPGVRLD